MSNKADGGGGGDRPKSWPEAGKGITVHSDKLRAVAKALQDDYDKLNGNGGTTGSQYELNGYGNVGQREIGKYKAAEGLSSSTSAAYNQINSTYKNLLTSYKSIIDTINKTADNYDKADHQTEQAARKAGRGTTNPGNNNTGAY